MTAIVAHPVEVLGRVIVDAPDALGVLRRVEIERWSTDALGCEAWAVHTVDAPGVLGARIWYSTPAGAVAAAERRYRVAGYGSPPFGANQLLRGPLHPRGTFTADILRTAS